MALYDITNKIESQYLFFIFFIFLFLNKYFIFIYQIKYFHYFLSYKLFPGKYFGHFYFLGNIFLLKSSLGNIFYRQNISQKALFLMFHVKHFSTTPFYQNLITNYLYISILYIILLAFINQKINFVIIYLTFLPFAMFHVKHFFHIFF